MQPILSLLLAATASAMPTLSTREATCESRSREVSNWMVRDFDYHASYLFTNPAHQVSTGYVNFTLGNPALNYRAQCTAASTQLNDFFYGTWNYNCTNPEGNVKTDLATFNFSSPSGVLNVNQTWECEDAMSLFIAQGGIELDLDCETEEWTNPDWQQGEFYSTKYITCAHITSELPMEQKLVGV